MPAQAPTYPATETRLIQEIAEQALALTEQNFLTKVDEDRLAAMTVNCLASIALSLDRLAHIMSEEWQA